MTALKSWPLHANAKNIYCSPTGNDANSGIDHAHAVKTIQAAYNLITNNAGDHILCDTDNGPFLNDPGISSWNKNGKDATYPVLITVYGSGARAVFKVANSKGFVNSAATVSHNYIEFQSIRVEPFSDTQTKVPAWDLVAGGLNIGWEDCYVKRMRQGINIQGGWGTSGAKWTNVRFNRNYFENLDRTGSAGVFVYCDLCDNIIATQNVGVNFKANDSLTGGTTLMSHGWYIQAQGDPNGTWGSTDCGPVIEWSENIVYNCGRRGFNLRSGGYISNNLSIRGASNYQIGYGRASIAATICEWNVATENREEYTGQVAYGGGFLIKGVSHPGSKFQHNLVCHSTDAQSAVAYLFEDGPFSAFLFNTNVGYNWATSADTSPMLWIDIVDADIVTAITFSHNKFQHLASQPDIQITTAPALSAYGPPKFLWSTNTYHRTGNSNLLHVEGGAVAGDYNLSTWASAVGEVGSSFAVPSFPEPSRTVGGYAVSIGGLNDVEYLMALSLSQTRFAWDDRYGAAAINSYLRVGFGMGNPQIILPPPEVVGKIDSSDKHTVGDTL